MDKLEVIDEARGLGTFDISIEPDQDCCSLFVPRHPTTRARLDHMEALEATLDVEGWVTAAVHGATIERYRFPAPRATAEPEPLQQ
jgi:thiamine biosynthesis protein ThiI